MVAMLVMPTLKAPMRQAGRAVHWIRNSGKTPNWKQVRLTDSPARSCSSSRSWLRVPTGLGLAEAAARAKTALMVLALLKLEDSDDDDDGTDSTESRKCGRSSGRWWCPSSHILLWVSVIILSTIGFFFWSCWSKTEVNETGLRKDLG